LELGVQAALAWARMASRPRPGHPGYCQRVGPGL